ncbi:hypothetical protein C8A01DRAFT_36614 [Parachaetomium inaequale]|uniref:RING-type domain-containing protein n=1 Tax=Parachaetomium inaequale TaxID=2588326 RepID=A0AAN6PI41_9PEZI|nr:hypothetical protein C8A01DRAFT_36614 [Parachaetomium inaequale]
MARGWRLAEAGAASAALPPPAARATQQPVTPPQRRLDWGESAWNYTVEKVQAGRPWDERPPPSTAILLPCGHLLCPACLSAKSQDTANPRCYPTGTCFWSDNMASNCGHLLLHYLPGPCEPQRPQSAPLTLPEGAGRTTTCWSCLNLGLLIAVGDKVLELPFGRNFALSRSTPDKPLRIFYQKIVTEESELPVMMAMLGAGPGFGGIWAAMLQESPPMQEAVKVVVFEGTVGSFYRDDSGSRIKGGHEAANKAARRVHAT